MSTRTQSSESGLHRVVIVGGGFGGVRAARQLSRDRRIAVTLVDRTNHHLFQPLLYQVATGILSPGQIAPALRSLFRRRKRVRVLLANVERFDLEARQVHARTDAEFAIPYDTLILAAGATHSYFGHNEWEQHAPGMKTLDDAARLRSRILGAFELAEQDAQAADRDEHLTFVVVGAGPTGVELAGQIAVLARRILPPEYRTIDTTQAKIILIDAAPAVLGTFPKQLQDRARRDLEALGVDVQLGAMATAIDEFGITVSEDGAARRIPARTVVWAAGVAASPLGASLAEAAGEQVQADRAGRVIVEPDCSLPGHPNIFVIGDLAYLPGVPGVAQPAMQEGVYVGRLIRGRLNGKPAPKPFKYRDKGNLATIGRTRAVGEIHGLNVAGFPAFAIWAFVHVAYLVGWGNRFEAIARWLWTIVARNRRERLISVVSLVSQETAVAEQDKRTGPT